MKYTFFVNFNKHDIDNFNQSSSPKNLTQIKWPIKTKTSLQNPTREGKLRIGSHIIIVGCVEQKVNSYGKVNRLFSI